MRRLQRQHPADRGARASRNCRGRSTTSTVDVSGKRGINGLKFRGIATDQNYTHFEDQPAYDEVDKIASSYLEQYITGQIDRLDVVYTKFISTSRQIADDRNAVAPGFARDDGEAEAKECWRRRAWRVRISSVGREHSRRSRADQLQGQAVQVLSWTPRSANKLLE